MLKYETISELVSEATKRNIKISELVLADQAAGMDKTEIEVYKKMKDSFRVMIESVKVGLQKDLRSTSGLTGGEGYLMNAYAEKDDGGLSGNFMSKAMARALAVAGCNASMGKIVAAPTAGSCGILPGCLVSLYEDKGYNEKDIVMSMFTAAAFGMVVANRASLAGAEGGCQAECGSAAAMAAAALVELRNGSPSQCADACAIAISSQMGLVCDPVAGLVEIPCIKRNVSGLAIAFSSADMALAGIGAKIPVDECLDAMKEVGEALPSSLRETARGGLAATPTGKALRDKIFGKGII
ncbi:L-serine ammonia-lyase, iron-sulfur-dependent, subunit alpha [Butyrivibrio sp. YAB3001]|uniref:L-serine ammonia-lyase, iron-sulfur-dependent, subunit alpha n=1 Tax=Butyrivibrio sp. YAB3001 TaxID=1520812 RepID=UPI0008F652A9|nr:L-serine ammonia-lyase, iron-sulfur-dependent, subunit alpha [Butyrivibrio sp. YAB3001]SFB72502.1 L-serine dehydratase [Butyrivibrio sp. YAB3001]